MCNVPLTVLDTSTDGGTLDPSTRTINNRMLEKQGWTSGYDTVHIKLIANTKTDYPCITQVWECKTCNRCPLKKDCTKAKKRVVRINRVLDDLKAHAKELLDSEAGIQLIQQRCIQAEGTFGIIKNDWQYNRIHRRGMENVENELYLICMGFNLMKYHQKKMRMILS